MTSTTAFVGMPVGQAASVNNAQTLDAVGEIVAVPFRFATATTLKSVKWRLNAIALNPGNLGVVVATSSLNQTGPDHTAGVPDDATSDGAGGGSATLVTHAISGLSVGTQTTTFTNACSIAANTLYWICFYPKDGTWNGTNDIQIAVRNSIVDGGFGAGVVFSSDSGSSWSDTQGLALITLVDNGDNPIAYAGYCPDGNATTRNFNTADTPDEYGNRWTVPDNLAGEVTHWSAMLIWLTASGQAVPVIWKDTTEVWTGTAIELESIDEQNSNLAVYNVEVDTTIAFTGGEVIRMGLRSDSASLDVRAYYIRALGSAELQAVEFNYGGCYSYSTTNASSSFNDLATDLYQMSLTIQIDDQSAGGGFAYVSGRNTSLRR